MEEVLRYLFSAISQSAAAFAALIAVFAVFRLQTAQSKLNEEYNGARHFLLIKVIETNELDIANMNKQQIKEEIKRRSIDDNTEEIKIEAKNRLNKINQAEEESNKIALATSSPMKKWAFIFLESLIALYFAGIVRPWIIHVCAVVIFISIIYALWESKSYIQNCLKNSNV